MPLKEALEQCVNMMVVRRMKGTQLVMTLNRSVWILQSFPYISCPSIMIDGNFCCDINKTFNYKYRWRKKKEDYNNYYYYYYYPVLSDNPKL